MIFERASVFPVTEYGNRLEFIIDDSGNHYLASSILVVSNVLLDEESFAILDEEGFYIEADLGENEIKVELRLIIPLDEPSVKIGLRIVDTSYLFILKN